MALKFYDENHVYELDGVAIPSVSEIIRFLSREVYSDINKYVLDNAAERGTAIHAATVLIDETGGCEVEPEHEGYVRAYAEFVRDYGPTWLVSEKPFSCPVRGYAGTPDRVGFIDGQMSIVDLKTNAAIKKLLVKAQLNGYGMMMQHNGYQIECLHCLQLLPTGKYRLYPVAIDDSEFMWCYNIHMALKRKHGRGRIE